MENFSCLLSDISDCIGCSQEIIKVRRNFWQAFSQFENSRRQNLTLIIAGSKGEGITSLYESDIDNMFVLKDVICTDNIQALLPASDFTVLHSDTSETPPGYTRLRLITCNGAISTAIFRDTLFESERNGVYISSTLFATSVMQNLKSNPGNSLQYGELSGPSTPCVDKTASITMDSVVAFNHHHPQLLQTWKSRRRLYDWPPENVREAAASMVAQVVPVGCKTSVDQWREWRFCFLPSEQILIYSLNETQIKLYILLKMVSKDILRNSSNEITSYIMKNITFWLSELLPEVVFKKENLFSLLMLSLRFLKSCVSIWNTLPYYMIPGRNLLAERLSHYCRRQLTDLLGTLIAEGPRIILRCTKLRAALTVSLQSPSLLVDYRCRRDTLEMLFYLNVILVYNKADSATQCTVNLKVLNLLLPEWITLLYCGIPAKSVVDLFIKRQKFMLS